MADAKTRIRLPIVFVDITERNGLAQSRRVNRAGDGPDRLVGKEDRVSLTRRFSTIERQADQLLINMPARTNALDDLLSEIATFVKVHCMILSHL